MLGLWLLFRVVVVVCTSELLVEKSSELLVSFWERFEAVQGSDVGWELTCVWELRSAEFINENGGEEEEEEEEEEEDAVVVVVVVVVADDGNVPSVPLEHSS